MPNQGSSRPVRLPHDDNEARPDSLADVVAAAADGDAFSHHDLDAYSISNQPQHTLLQAHCFTAVALLQPIASAANVVRFLNLSLRTNLEVVPIPGQEPVRLLKMWYRIAHRHTDVYATLEKLVAREMLQLRTPGALPEETIIRHFAFTETYKQFFSSAPEPLKLNKTYCVPNQSPYLKLIADIDYHHMLMIALARMAERIAEGDPRIYDEVGLHARPVLLPNHQLYLHPVPLRRHIGYKEVDRRAGIPPPPPPLVEFPEPPPIPGEGRQEKKRRKPK